MLRIHDRGIARTQPEERRIEAIDVIQDRRCPDVVRIFQAPPVYAPAAINCSSPSALIDSTPSRRFRQNSRIVARSGKSARHPNYGDRGAGKMFSVSLIRLRPNRYGLHRAAQ